MQRKMLPHLHHWLYHLDHHSWQDIWISVRYLMFQSWYMHHCEYLLQCFLFKAAESGIRMSLRDWSVKILRRGLWSMHITRSLHPRSKYRAFFMAWTIASASPSIGAYLHSAFDVNLLPARVVSQAVLQQKSVMGRHKQCFCRSQ